MKPLRAQRNDRGKAEHQAVIRHPVHSCFTERKKSQECLRTEVTEGGGRPTDAFAFTIFRMYSVTSVVNI